MARKIIIECDIICAIYSCLVSVMKRPALLFEILVALACKLTLLYLLWWFCFSNPLDKNLQAEQIAGHLFTLQEGLNHES